ncbi:MAG: hypothetical protein NC218_03415 [Acetobacter sp.]|nr:hypothetical protein [Acetobacter sp.]
MNLKEKQQLLKQIKSARGSLDFCEFVVDPDNKNSDAFEIGACVKDFYKTLGIDESEWREMLLTQMRAARQARESWLESEVRDVRP